jgi:hypothetical protein
MMGHGSIEYSMTDEPRGGSMNGAVSVKADDQTLYFEALGMQSSGRDKENLTFQGAAELFWELFNPAAAIVIASSGVASPFLIYKDSEVAAPER